MAIQERKKIKAKTKTKQIRKPENVMHILRTITNTAMKHEKESILKVLDKKELRT